MYKIWQVVVTKRYCTKRLPVITVILTMMLLNGMQGVGVARVSQC